MTTMLVPGRPKYSHPVCAMNNARPTDDCRDHALGTLRCPIYTIARSTSFDAGLVADNISS